MGGDQAQCLLGIEFHHASEATAGEQSMWERMKGVMVERPGIKQRNAVRNSEHLVGRGLDYSRPVIGITFDARSNRRWSWPSSSVPPGC